MNKLIIVRGPSGSGKTTFAKKVTSALKNTVVFEADDFFYKEGSYQFDASKLGTAHKLCQMKTRLSLQKGKNVIVSNTSTRLRELKPYLDIAEDLNVPVVVVRMKSRYKNEHGVSEEKVDEMFKRMEDFPGEITPYEFLKTIV